MDATAQGHLDEIVETYRQAAPEGWLRIVVWVARLADGDALTDTLTRVERALVWRDGEVRAEYPRVPAQVSLTYRDLATALAGGPDAGWTMLRLEIDRDGTVRADLSDEAPQQLEGSAGNVFWDAVHDYLDRNPGELAQLVEKLRAEGHLPG